MREEGLQFKQHPKRRHVGDVGKLALHRKHDTAARAIFLLLVVSDAWGPQNSLGDGEGLRVRLRRDAVQKRVHDLRGCQRGHQTSNLRLDNMRRQAKGVVDKNNKPAGRIVRRHERLGRRDGGVALRG